VDGASQFTFNTHEVCHYAKMAVVVLMQTLGTLLADRCPDVEFLMQFPSKTLLGRFPLFNLPAWKLPQPGKILAARSTS
jgi:hypothetical protein